MQRSGSMPQAACANDPAGASLRSLSDAHFVFGANSNQIGVKYEIKKKIELYKGSVSTVYKCLLSGGKAVVIKTYHKGKMADKHFHKLEREVAAMRALCREVGRKGVVQLLDTYEDAQGIYLVMECCEGGDLFKRLMLHGGKLPEQWVCVEVIAPLLRVLERMHDLHLMHRDIKPENIFITADGQVKLGDFGLAIDWTKELPFSRSGTLDYMAPEVLINPATHTQESPSVTVPQLANKNIRPYTSAVDVWAVGCLAYELVCGRPPFEVEDEKQTASLIIYSHNIHFEATATPAWADFVTQALIKDPRQRPDASTLLGHQWIRSNLERAAAGVPVVSAYGRAASGLSAAAAAAADAAAAAADTQPTSDRSGGALRSPSLAAAAVASGGGSSACGTASMVGDGSSSGSGVSTGGSSAAAAHAQHQQQQQQQRTCTPSTTSHGFRTAAAMLATRASQPSPSTPPPPSASAAAAATATSATTSPVTTSGAVYSGGLLTAAQPQPRSAPPTQVMASGGFRAGNTGGGGAASSSGALRSLLDAFKNASICSGAAATNTATYAERAAGTPSAAAAAAAAGSVRQPSAGSYYRCSSGTASGGIVSSGNITASVGSISGAVGGGGGSAGQLLRTSFHFQLPPTDRDRESIPVGSSSSSIGGSQYAHLAGGKSVRSSFHVQIPLSSDRERERDRDPFSLGGSSTAAIVGCRTGSGAASAREPGASEPLQNHYQLPPSPPLLTRTASPVQRSILASSGSSGRNGSGSGSPVGAAVAAAAAGGGHGNGGFASPSRIARSGAATTGGLISSQAGSASLLTTPPRSLGSLSSAGVCGRAPSPPAQQRSDQSLVAGSTTSPGGQLGKPPRPQADTPAKVLAPPAAAAPPPCGSAPSLRTGMYSSPPRLQPQVAGNVSAEWAAAGGGGGAAAASASPSALHDLTRNWGAVVSISVSKLSSLVGNGRRSGSGSAFSSPQRLPAQGKALDSYGLPAPTPVASGLPPADYCSPRPVGVLERVKYHLRGGSGAGAASSPTRSSQSGTQQQQSQQQQSQQLLAPGMYGNHALSPIVPVAPVDVM